ncbi:hypothetical protein COCC4DRAFT_66532 [Bipolaris maydis ATCC 48331]|uniref:BTB domain-containing protein n=2 Tax=Cochliobolus heterostrophus TaxID=5016 RepID=M2UAY0_COCH5|nr:uncharacterized protein COCC4DRAFT_66532 [Bipolaris maydis ATCC 48331]EMD85158.1 hypothetical protein COCHEDRAFT_1119827 [Bipolaris maydis C5]KAJ5026927.1 hypothetical protein J3E73DRAFT_188489 [Bipolaris maydis]ENH99383.1 hypothetical protein COCC4DRAFT_66532 [Bipolaris maydis ATCC 48331]KAJ6209313.1 hypothetical protein PSV09DRAFT_1119827 [Bipolaris maydis]KAJ6271676.1 hypothetical protein PSV08DRAFT_370949 [Bipolaris maydis]
MATPSPPKATRSNPPKKALFFGSVAKQSFVVIKVGPEKVPYEVHKALLTHYSEYFSSALNGPWKEAQENSITLNDIDPKTFGIFVHWLYTQKIATEEEVNHILETHPCDEHDDNPYITVLTEAVVFGDRFLAPDFRKAAQNHTVDYICRQNGKHMVPFLYASKYAFENLPDSHKLCKFLIVVHCHYMRYHGGYMDGLMTGWYRDNLPRTFLVGLIKRYTVLAEILSYSGYGPDDRCTYHEHADRHERNECKQEAMRK